MEGLGNPLSYSRVIEARKGPKVIYSASISLNPRPLSSSFLWFIFRILQGHPQKERLRGLWVNPTV